MDLGWWYSCCIRMTSLRRDSSWPSTSKFLPQLSLIISPYKEDKEGEEEVLDGFYNSNPIHGPHMDGERQMIQILLLQLVLH